MRKIFPFIIGLSLVCLGAGCSSSSSNKTSGLDISIVTSTDQTASTSSDQMAIPPDMSATSSLSTTSTLPTDMTSSTASATSSTDSMVSSTIVITWHAPQPIASFHLLENLPTLTASYYKVGTATSGTYINDDVILVVHKDTTNGTTKIAGTYEILQNPTQLVLLSRYSAPVDNLVRPNKITSSDNIDIPALDLPTTIPVPKSPDTLSVKLNPGVIFNPGGSQIVFNSDILGPIYAPKNNDSEEYFAIAADGQEIDLQLNDDFLNSLTPIGTAAPIAWNDGTQNTTSYALGLPAMQCGTSTSSTVSLPTITLMDLTPAGKNADTQTVYALTNPQNPLLVAANQVLQNIKLNDNSVPTSTTPLIIFWVDPFGRVIPFENSILVGHCAQ